MVIKGKHKVRKKKPRLQLDPPLYLIYKNNNIFHCLWGLEVNIKHEKKTL